MIMLRWLFRMLPLVGLMVIATSFVRVISISEVLSAWSAEIDEQEEIYTAGQGDCSAEDIIRGLCMYGRVIYKYNFDKYIKANWLYKQVMIGLILLLPWCVTIGKDKCISKT